MSEFIDARINFNSQTGRIGGGLEYSSNNDLLREQSFRRPDSYSRASDYQHTFPASKNQGLNCFEHLSDSQRNTKIDACENLIRQGTLPQVELGANASVNRSPVTNQQMRYSRTSDLITKPVPVPAEVPSSVRIPVPTPGDNRVGVCIPVPTPGDNRVGVCIPVPPPCENRVGVSIPVPLPGENRSSVRIPVPPPGENRSIERVPVPSKNIDKADNSDCAKQLSLLSAKSSTPDQKLRAIQSLVAAGKTNVELELDSGKKVKVRLEVEQTGDRQMVHMFVRDEKNKEKAVIRGITKEDGKFERERDRKGRFVDYYGSGAKLVYESANQNKICRASDTKPGRTLTDGGTTGTTREASFVAKGNEQQIKRPANEQNSRYEGQSYAASATGYYPDNSPMEGGFKDKLGKPLYTLQQYLKGDAPHVSVAMDDRAGIKYGQEVRIKELEQKYGRPIVFKVVDTGGAFRGKGTSRIDICTDNASETYKVTGNVTLTFPQSNEVRNANSNQRRNTQLAQRRA